MFWILVPTLPKLAPQPGAKIYPKSLSKSPPKSIPNRILFLITFCIDVLIDFWLIFQQKSTADQLKNQPAAQQPK